MSFLMLKKNQLWIKVKNVSPFWDVIIAKFAWNTINANFNTCTLLSLPVLSCTWYKIKKIFSKFIQCVFLLLQLNMVKIKNEQDYLKFSVYKYTVYHRVYAVIETTLHQIIYEQFKGGSKDYSLASTLSDQYQYLVNCPPTPPLTQH